MRRSDFLPKLPRKKNPNQAPPVPRPNFKDNGDIDPAHGIHMSIYDIAPPRELRARQFALAA